MIRIWVKNHRVHSIIHVEREAYLRIRNITILKTTSFGGIFNSFLDKNYHLAITNIDINAYQFYLYKYKQAIEKSGFG